MLSRPDNWVVEDADLHYGDQFVTRPISLVTCEVDGEDYM